MSRNEHGSHRSHFLVFACLMLLAVASYGLSFASLGAMRVPAALVVSTAKVGLVTLFFMELIEQRATNRFVLAGSLVLVCTLIGLMGTDVLTRDTPALQTPRVERGLPPE